jgi:sugar phosphate isomerase/epimerase
LALPKYTVLINTFRKHFLQLYFFIYLDNLLFNQNNFCKFVNLIIEKEFPMKRRDFIKTSAAAVFYTGSLLKLSQAAGSGKLEKVGLQLYSVRGQMGEDFTGTLTRVAEAGYDQVEFAGYYDHSPAEIKALLDQLGITAPACHSGYDTLKDDRLEQTIEAAKTIGHKYLIMPVPPIQGTPRPKPQPVSDSTANTGEQPAQPQRRQWEPPSYSLDQVKNMADIFNQIGKSCKKADLRFAYHNHSMEFQEIEGSGIMYDLLLERTDPDLVDFEIDLGWAVAAGADPVAYFEKYPGRFKLFHVKDMNAENRSVVVGQGKIDFASIFAQSGKAGVKYYIVEYEGREDPMGSVAASVTYLKNMTY